MKKIQLRVTGLLLSAGVVAGAIVLGLGAAGVTYAALSASTTVPGATITAGSQAITVNGASTAAVGNVVVVPGAPQVVAFTVGNTGTAPVEIGTSVAVTTTPAIKNNMLARFTSVTSPAECVPDLGGAQAPLIGYTADAITTVPAGSSAIVCLEVALDSATPISQAGQSAGFKVTVTGTSTTR